jgi:transposase-like protein
MTKDEKINTWRDIINKQAASGISAANFCREQNLNKNQFHWWRRRFRKDNSPNKESGFLQLVAFANPKQSGVRICLRDKVFIEVEQGFDPQTLRRVVEAICEDGTKPCWL